jgi:hypothetical protein
MQHNYILKIAGNLPQSVKTEIVQQKNATGYVDMGHWGSTNPDAASFLSSLISSPDKYLITHGAATCLNVIVHNTNKSYGCLTHIAHVAAADLDQGALYLKASKIIRGLIGKCRSDPNDHIEIWFGSGYAFNVGSPYSPQHPVPQPFPTYLSAQLNNLPNIYFLPSNIVQMAAPDGMPDPGHVLYLPTFATAYLLTTEQWMGLNINSQQSAKIGGNCSDFL